MATPRVVVGFAPCKAMPERRPVKVLHDGLHQPERSGGLCGASWSGLYRAQRRHHPATEPWPPSADAVKRCLCWPGQHLLSSPFSHREDCFGMEERHVTTGPGRAKPPSGSWTVSGYSPRSRIMAEGLKSSPRPCRSGSGSRTTNCSRHAVRSSRRRGTGASGPELGSSRRHPLRSA